MESMNLNALLAGSATFSKKEDEDLKDLFPNLTVQPRTLNGGFRVLYSGLYESVLKERVTGVLTDYRGKTAEVGVVQSNLQTANYRKFQCAPFPPDEAVEYGKVQYDNSDHLRIWVGAYVLGDLRIYDSCAIKWRDSTRYLLVPYTANVYNMDVDFFGPRSCYRYVYVSGYPRQCLGTIKSGGLEAVAYNRDLLADFDEERWGKYPHGFIPVFWPEKKTDLATIQDDALGAFLGQFMPNDDDESILPILEDQVPGISDLLHDFLHEEVVNKEAMINARDLIPETYVQDGWSQKVYEAYIKILAATYVDTWNRGIDHLEGRR